MYDFFHGFQNSYDIYRHKKNCCCFLNIFGCSDIFVMKNHAIFANLVFLLKLALRNFYLCKQLFLVKMYKK